ncbi:MAG: HpcH/HpaI aldolase/citrate lyase family protein [Treponemataceae bacterium]
MDRLFRTFLFCPASNPKMLYTAMNYEPDAIIFDLEDAVPYDEKIDSRELLAEALQSVDYGNNMILARINNLSTPFGNDDIMTLIPAGLRVFRYPMCETVDDLNAVDMVVSEAEKIAGIPIGTVKIIAALETPLGIYNAFEIAKHSRILGLSLGGEDLTRCLGATRTAEGYELAYSRSRIVCAASIAGKLAIDTVWTDISNEAGFRTETEIIKNMGFSGRACVHPSQIPIVHEIYTPSMNEVEKSIRIVEAARQAHIEKGGVIQLDGKMIDMPLINKAERILTLAKLSGLITGGFDENNKK